MPYTIKSRAGTYGGLSILAADPREALDKAREMEDDGLQDVRIVDATGVMHAATEFRRFVEAAGLSDGQIRLIEDTAGAFLSVPLRAAGIFYDQVFAIAPEARSLFPDDLAQQKKKLEDTLTSMVGAIREPERLASLVTGLGHRHARYGVEPSHYGPVGDALLMSLEQILGPRFTPEVRAAWMALYGEISAAMLRAQAEAPPAH